MCLTELDGDVALIVPNDPAQRRRTFDAQYATGSCLRRPLQRDGCLAIDSLKVSAFYAKPTKATDAS